WMTKINIFLLTSILSRIGNACADYAFVWIGLEALGIHDSAGKVSLVYIGQACGVIFLTPIISTFFDRFERKAVSVAIDVIYGVVLAASIAIYKLGELDNTLIFAITAIVASLGMAHHSSVTIYAFKVLGEGVKKSKIGEKFALTLSLSYFVGVAVSGTLFEYVGFSYCLLFGILSFFPVMLVYLLVLPKVPSTVQKSFKQLLNFAETAKNLFQDKPLFRYTALIAFLNIVASIFPTILGANLAIHFPGRTDIYAYSISIGIFIGIAMTPVLSKFATHLNLKSVLPVFYFPLVALLLLWIAFPNPYLGIFAFGINCGSSAGINIVSGALRVSRIANERMGRSNTFIAILLFFGQLIGGVFVLPTLGNETFNSFAVWTMIVVFTLTGVMSLLILPKNSTEELSN
ncbi:MAG: MFS transporter, partial [Bdellovibrionales bacterium]|nr:MFS transporter [Bdellovibrionales bacterium]